MYRCGNTGHYIQDPTCQLAARPVATLVVPITLLLYANHSPVPPAECALSTRCQMNDESDESEDEPAFAFHLKDGCSGKCSKCSDESEDEPAFAFHLKDSSKRGPTVKANIGGVDMQILVDSGATKNIVDVTTWEWLKQKHIICESKVAQRHKKLYSYASTTPLQVKCTFSTTVKIGSKETTAEFLVINGKGTPLLGHETATLFGVLRIGPLISAVSSVEEELAKRKDEIEQEVLSRVEEAKSVMEEQILEEFKKNKNSNRRRRNKNGKKVND